MPNRVVAATYLRWKAAADRLGVTMVELVERAVEAAIRRAPQ